MRRRPLVPLLLVLLVPATAASWSDAVQALDGGDAGPWGWGFERSGDDLHGALVDAVLQGDGVSDVRLGGEPLLSDLAWRPGTWSLDGPLAVLDAGDGALSLHDNPHGWLTVRGEEGTVVLTGTKPWSLGADGATASAGRAVVHLEQPGSLAADGMALMATFDGPVGLAVHDADAVPSIHGHAPRAGAWAVLALGAGGRATADWMNVHGAPFALADWDGAVASLDVVGTLGDGAPDLLLRFDLHGMDADHLVARAAGRVASRVDASSVLDDERGPFSFHAEAGTVLLRLPAGLSGRVTLASDAEPATLEVLLRDVEDTWAPQDAVPTLVLVANEPGTAVLRVGDDYEKHSVVYAPEHRFRLIGLRPETDYAYEATFTDLAGNEATTDGTFRTGVAQDGLRTVRLEPERVGDDAWVVLANVTDETGLAVADGVTVFLDKRPATATFDGALWRVVVTDLAPGVHELAVEARGPDGVERAVVSLAGPDEASPAPLLVPTLGVLCAAWVARRR